MTACSKLHNHCLTPKAKELRFFGPPRKTYPTTLRRILED